MAIFPPRLEIGSGFSSTTQPELYFAQTTLNTCWTTAQTATNAFDGIVAGAVSRIDAQSLDDTLVVDRANETPVVEPVITIPTSVDPTDVMSMFDTKYTELVALLVEKFTTFQNTYFPNEGANYAVAETWITNAMNNPDHGIPAAVAAQMLTDVKSRAYADAAVQSDAVLATFAARRFPLPPGAAASAVLQISQKAQDSISESSRALMMKYIENMRFAVENTLSMREKAMGAAIAYINALASGPSLASGLVGTGYDAQSKLISSAASFYNARTEASRMVKQAEQFNVDRKFAKDEKNVSNDIVLMQDNVKLLLVEAQALAQVATSLFNNLHVSTSVSASA
jgi:hypothetical protein